MGTFPPTLPARNAGEQQIHCFRTRFQVANVPAFAPGIKIGRLPARSFLSRVQIYKAAAFNSATTDTIQLGSTQTGVDLLGATDVKTAAGYVDLTAAAGLGIVQPLETDLWMRYLQSGAAATLGDVTVLISYFPDNDQ
jgi:hypothetical protein